MLARYPEEAWHGGTVQVIRPGVLHLLRGQVYEIEGKTFFAMGGAACHDLYNGVLEMDDPDFERKYRELRFARKFFRINHVSWWEGELPTGETLDAAWENLLLHGKKVDYVLSHCAPTRVQAVDGAYLMGRNYDFKNNTSAMLVHAAPKDGYASVAFAALDNVKANAADASLKSKLSCLAAPFLCLDGVNEKGMAIAVLTLDSEPTRQSTGKQTIATTLAIRLVLDRAATTEEAVQLLANIS